MPRPSHPSWLDHSDYTWRRVQVMKFLIGILLLFKISVNKPSDLVHFCLLLCICSSCPIDNNPLFY
jgi:hypothetical protein